MIQDKGGGYIRKELSKIDLDKKEVEVRKSAEKKTGSALDTTVKQLKYIRALKEQNLRPEDAYIISNVPVVPPVIRPVLPGKGGQELVYGDINPLYRDLLYVNNQFKEVKTSHLVPGDENKMRPALHEAVGAVFGVNDPVTTKSRARGHKGFLTYIAGTTSPKYGFFQSKIMKRSQDVSGRGTIVPDHTLGLDEVGIPEEMMWTMYDKFIVRRLVQNGYSAIKASQMIKERSPIAREMLLRETKERPVIVNRAPTLHRYNMVAAYPQMTAGKTIRVHPFIEAGMNADYDGDTMMVHAPVTPKSVEEAKTMTLSNILFSDKSKSDLLVFPKHEAIMGLAHASQQDDKGKPVKFKTGTDAMVAYKAGKINLGTRVIIENE
jgi:DNA-directed RNA polymerase subunit beta'